MLQMKRRNTRHSDPQARYQRVDVVSQSKRAALFEMPLRPEFQLPPSAVEAPATRHFHYVERCLPLFRRRRAATPAAYSAASCPDALFEAAERDEAAPSATILPPLSTRRQVRHARRSFSLLLKLPGAAARARIPRRLKRRVTCASPRAFPACFEAHGELLIALPLLREISCAAAGGAERAWRMSQKRQCAMRAEARRAARRCCFLAFISAPAEPSRLPRTPAGLFAPHMLDRRADAVFLSLADRALTFE